MYRITFTSSRVRSISISVDARLRTLYFGCFLMNLRILKSSISRFAELLLRGIPAALPADHDAGAKADRINFLTHKYHSIARTVRLLSVACTGTALLRSIVDRHVMCAIRRLIHNAMPRAAAESA